jgi:hypothetical protein
MDTVTEEEQLSWAERMAGYNTKVQEEKSRKHEEFCVPYSFWNLETFLMRYYGVDLYKKMSRVGGIGLGFFEDPIYEFIKSFEIHKQGRFFGNIRTKRKVLSIVALKNLGTFDARQIKVRFNFIENSIVKGGPRGPIVSNLSPSWTIFEEPILLEGGTIRKFPPHGAEIAYDTLSNNSPKLIFVVTYGNFLSDQSYTVETVPYIPQATYPAVGWGVVSLIVLALIATVLKLRGEKPPDFV